MGERHDLVKETPYEERENLFKAFLGKNVAVTVQRSSYLTQTYQGKTTTTEIPYTLTHHGKIKEHRFNPYAKPSIVFLEAGKRAPMRFDYAQISGVKAWERPRRRG